MDGETQDKAKAIAIYQSQSKQGNSTASIKLADLYLNLWGEKHNFAKAIYWYKKAEDQGSLEALNMLAYIFQLDEFSEKNLVTSFNWRVKAAHHAEASSHEFSELAILYEKGIGTEQNFEKAKLWYIKAASHQETDIDNKTQLAWFLVSSKDPSKEDIELSQQWLEKSLEESDGDQFYLPDLLSIKALQKYHLGEFNQAIELQRKAIEIFKNHPDSEMYFLPKDFMQEQLNRYLAANRQY